MGHPYRLTGIYKTSKHDSRFHLYQFRQSIEMGWTLMNENAIDQLVNDLKHFYMGFDYDTIKKNSIHFARYLLEQLSHQPIQFIHIPFCDFSHLLSLSWEYRSLLIRYRTNSSFH